MTAPVAHRCIRCKELPEKPAGVILPTGANWVRHGYRPKKPAKIVTLAGKPERCTHHAQVEKKRVRAQRQAGHVQRFAGITEEQYQAIYRHQGGKCAFPNCRANGKTKRLAIHHNHQYAAEHCDHDPKTQACPACIVALICGPHNHDLLGKWLVDLDDAVAMRDGLISPAQEVLSHV